MLLYVCMVVYSLAWPDPILRRGAIAYSISAYTTSNNTYIGVSVFLTILLQQFTFKSIGEVKDVEKTHSFVTTPKDPLKYQIHPIC